MDSSDHPVVQRGIKAAELISDVSDEKFNPAVQRNVFRFKSFAFVTIMRFVSVHVSAESNEYRCRQHHGCCSKT